MTAKLEACCREQKEQMTSLAKENQSIAEEERQRHTELKARILSGFKPLELAFK